MSISGSPKEIAATATQILASNPGRLGFQIQNIGNATIYVGPANTVLPETPAAGSPLHGVRIQSSETWFQYLGEGLYTGDIYAICDNGSTSKVTFFELQ